MPYSVSTNVFPLAGDGTLDGAASAVIGSTEAVTMALWSPKSPLQILDPSTLKLNDVAFTLAGTAGVILTPLPEHEKITVFGRLDVRTARAGTHVALSPGDILVNPSETSVGGEPEGWIALTHSDNVPGQQRLRTLVRYLHKLPTDIAAATL